jgi:HEAT repeat protein
MQRQSSNVLTFKHSFLTGSEQERSHAKRRLLSAARSSREKRREVVEALISIVELYTDEDQTVSFPVWRDAVELLGNIRAKEAVDVLVNHLTCSGGTVGYSIGGRPAVVAIVRIGESAVPKLADAMSDRRAAVRESAAQALGIIGGPHAKEILEQALLRETEDQVRRLLEIELSSLSKQKRGQPKR